MGCSLTSSRDNNIFASTMSNPPCPQCIRYWGSPWAYSDQCLGLLIATVFTVPRCQIREFHSFVGIFSKLWKATITIVMSVCPSICLVIRMEQLSSHWIDSHEILHSRTFRISAQKINVSLKSDKNNRYFTWRHTSIYSYDTNADNIRTNILHSIIIFQKSCYLWDNMERYGITR